MNNFLNYKQNVNLENKPADIRREVSSVYLPRSVARGVSESSIRRNDVASQHDFPPKIK